MICGYNQISKWSNDLNKVETIFFLIVSKTQKVFMPCGQLFSCAFSSLWLFYL